MSGDVSSIAEGRTHLFNGERVLCSGGLLSLPGGNDSDKGGDIDPGSSDARLAEPDVRVHRDAWEHFHRLLPIVSDFTTQEVREPRIGQLSTCRPDHFGGRASSTNGFSDPCGFPQAYATDLRQAFLVGCHDAFDRAKLDQQPLSQRWAHTGQALKHVKSPRSDALWLAVVPSKNVLLRVSHLLRQKAQDPQRILWIARVKYGEPPHHRQRHDRSFQRVWMDIWHPQWFWAFE